MKENELFTFGCRLNSFESDQIRKLAENAGLKDLAIFNSCGVTNQAVRQVRQSIRKTRRHFPEKCIIVTGCAVQMHPEMFEDMPEIDHIIGNAEKLNSESYQLLAKGALPRTLVSDIMEVRETAPHMTDAYNDRTRAFVEVQNGCDHRCTFCIIPFGRGPSRSAPSLQIIENIKALVGRGYQEIVLTGVDITDYNDPDASGDIVSGLGLLVERILREIPDLPRLRISSIDAIETDAHLLEILASEQRLMPHLHLSLQAGDNMILKRMKRRHLREDAIELCQTLFTKRKDLVLGADLIAGFPTENDEMFENTLKLIDQCNLTFLHVFPFSPREGTPAARMPQNNSQIIKERARRLRLKGEKCLQKHLKSVIGKTTSVLMETEKKGRTPWFSEVILDSKQKAGEILPVAISGYSHNKLTGTPVRRSC